MMMRSTRKPPLALRSPIRLRPRRPLQSSLNNPHTPSGFSTKSRLPKQSSNLEEPELRPEYQTISCELRALTKMVQDNLRGSATTSQSANAYDASPLFQRGRFYDEYSARRNERLKRKRGGESVVEKKTPCKQFLGVRMESAKKTGEVKKFETARKMTTTTPLVERREVATTQRYSLRSSCKENKKPPLAMSFEKSMEGTVEKKTAVRRTTRKGRDSKRNPDDGMTSQLSFEAAKLCWDNFSALGVGQCRALSMRAWVARWVGQKGLVTWCKQVEAITDFQPVWPVPL